MMIRKPKIIVWDIETSTIQAHTWSLYPKYISHDAIIQDWSIICGAWKELGSKKINTVKIKKFGDDYEVVKTLRDALADADIVIHHNGDKFDIKKLTARLIFHSLPPLPKIVQLDTLKEVRKVAAFSSNRLDFLSKTLVGAGKLHTGFDLWLQVQAGSKTALKEMVEYNKVDVIRLEEIYERILPYMKNPPHRGVLAGLERTHSCKACGSSNVKLNGTRFTAAGLKRQEIKCKDCHHYSLHPFVTVK